MEAFLPDTLKAILMGLIAIVFVLSRLARWLPHVAVLQVFRLPVIQMSEAQREKRRRFGNRMAGLEIVLAGRVYPFAYHQDYFQREIAPRLGRLGTRVRFIEQPDFTEKVNLLQRAGAVVVTSLVDETSSLVAMEAAACGTPVVGFRRGSLPEVVAHGRTGLLVKSFDEMQRAVQQVRAIDPRTCRARAEAEFGAGRMFRDYQRLYKNIAVSRRESIPVAA